MFPRAHVCLLALLLGPLAAANALAEKFTEEFHQAYPVSAESRISLANVNGNISIKSTDASEVRVDAIKRSSSQEHLQAVKIEVEARSDRVTIQTKYPDHRSGWFKKKPEDTTSVEYTLTVPRTARLDGISSVNGSINVDGLVDSVTASTVNGAVNANSLSGSTHVSTVNGSLALTFISLDKVKSVSASTVNGKVQINLPHEADANLSASTVNGSIGGDVKVEKHWPGGQSLNTKLGKGGPKISLSTVNGSVGIHLLVQAEQPAR